MTGPAATFREESALNYLMKNAKIHFWIKVLTVVGAVACGLSLLFATFGAAAGATTPESDLAQPALVQLAANRGQSYEGIVTDTHCGAKHSAVVGLSAGDCTRACVHSGEHFALVDGDKMYTLDGEAEALKRVAGQRVKVMGVLNGSTISVASVTAGAP
ncbi:MAG: hypothetical protein ABSC33_01055 [Candidatus Sulfotelmatobacter sp.]|jgi:hypothetical protein